MGLLTITETRFNGAIVSCQSQYISLDESNHRIVCIAHSAQHSQRWCPAPAGYPSANWRSRPEFRSSLSAAPMTPLSSWNNRTFSMAITAWSAKVSRSLICAGVKGRTSMRRAVSPSNEFPLLTKGTAKKVRQPLRLTDLGIVLRAGIGNVERAMLAHPANLWSIHTDLYAGEWVWDQNERA